MTLLALSAAMMKLAPLTVCALFLGCTPSTEPNGELIGERVRVLGTIDVGDGPQITLDPQSRSVAVSVTTFGPGCYSKADTKVEVKEDKAIVWPYNYAPLPESPCTRDLRPFVHTATIRFEESRTARVVVHGLSTATNPYGDSITVERRTALP